MKGLLPCAKAGRAGLAWALTVASQWDHVTQTVSSVIKHCQLQKPLQCIRLAGFAAVFPLAALCHLYKLTCPQAQTSEDAAFSCKRRNKWSERWCLLVHPPSRVCFGLQEGWVAQASPSSSCGQDTGCQGRWQWPCCPFHLHMHVISDLKDRGRSLILEGRLWVSPGSGFAEGRGDVEGCLLFFPPSGGHQRWQMLLWGEKYCS